MLILGIETSCDETAASLLEVRAEGGGSRRVLADVVSTQIDIHRRWGGVVPELASRNHVMQLMPVVDEALARAGRRLDEVELVSVTSGPGLVGALLVGVQAAKALSMALRVPLVGVNHIEGHLLAAGLMEVPPEPPFMGLVVSGGHTSLYDVKDYGAYERIGSTRDDAAGEAYDKVAKLLGLPYPGGLPIDRLAQTGDPRAIRFPRALREPGVYDWSFSGLKTAVAQHVQKLGGVPEGQVLADLCASFQEAVADALTKKLVAAARERGARSLVLCGGVASNSRLRSLALERASEYGIELFVPPPRWCTDNGAMIALAGFHSFRRGVRADETLNADPGWRL